MRYTSVFSEVLPDFDDITPKDARKFMKRTGYFRSAVLAPVISCEFSTVARGLACSPAAAGRIGSLQLMDGVFGVFGGLTQLKGKVWAGLGLSRVSRECVAYGCSGNVWRVLWAYHTAGQPYTNTSVSQQPRKKCKISLALRK